MSEHHQPNQSPQSMQNIGGAIPILIHQQSALSEKAAIIAETTQAQIQSVLSIINNIAGLNRYSEDKSINSEIPIYNFDEEVRGSTSATLIVANNRLQDLLRDDKRWKVDGTKPSHPPASNIENISQEDIEAQKEIIRERNKSIVASLKTAREVEEINLRRLKLDIESLEKKDIDNKTLK